MTDRIIFEGPMFLSRCDFNAILKLNCDPFQRGHIVHLALLLLLLSQLETKGQRDTERERERERERETEIDRQREREREREREKERERERETGRRSFCPEAVWVCVCVYSKRVFC